CNLEHRGAEGADADTGDGAGILLQMPDRFLREVVDFALPEAGKYGVAVCFFPSEATQAAELERLFCDLVGQCGLEVLGWRDVPVKANSIGKVARDAAPRVRQVFIS